MGISTLSLCIIIFNHAHSRIMHTCTHARTQLPHTHLTHTHHTHSPHICTTHTPHTCTTHTYMHHTHTHIHTVPHTHTHTYTLYPTHMPRTSTVRTRTSTHTHARTHARTHASYICTHHICAPHMHHTHTHIHTTHTHLISCILNLYYPHSSLPLSIISSCILLLVQDMESTCIAAFVAMVKVKFPYMYHNYNYISDLRPGSLALAYPISCMSFTPTFVVSLTLTLSLELTCMANSCA